MPKYSIIIPVYNTEAYLKKCLDSIINQTYKDFEIIVVNDGTKDNSQDIINMYVDKYECVKSIVQENQGLSVARNNGIKKARGKYFLVLDSDDYFEKGLLEELNKELEKNGDVDLMRFQVRNISKNTIDYHEEPFNNLNGIEAFKRIVKYHYVENACCYLYNREYFIKNNFEYKKGVYHEDFGLTPLVIEKAKSVSSIDYIGYDYVERENSIMTNKSYQKIIKKVNDFYECYLYVNEQIDSFPGDHSTLKSYLANSMLMKITELNHKDYKVFLKKLKKENIFDNLLVDTFSRKIKKLIISINPKLYYKKN